MGKDLLEQFRKDINDFKASCVSFYNSEISQADYKSISGGFGSYAERGLKTGMVRLRIPAGDLKLDWLKFVCGLIDLYNIKKVHFTTNQTIQLHGLKDSQICEIVEKALDVGIITRGGGGDFPRNTLVSPLTGVEVGEYFDVLPYAKAVSDYAISLIGKVKLPRKLKIGFSNSPRNIVHATYRDMGFVANPDNTFDLYTAGGLGLNPTFGIKTAEKIDPQKVLYYVKTMVQMFTTYGNYDVRAKARTRYIPKTIGEEKYLSEFSRMLKENLELADLDLNIKSEPIEKKGDGSVCELSRNVIKQKQDGLYAVLYHPITGFVNIDTFKQLYKVLSDFEGVGLRLSPNQGLYIINLTACEAEKVLGVLNNDNAHSMLQESISCVGSKICQHGICDSRDLLEKIIAVEKEENFSDGILPKIAISGCPSSCAAHQTAKIGFQGGKKKVQDDFIEVYKIFIGGCELQNRELFGEDSGTIIADKIPEMFREIGKSVVADNMVFDTWFDANTEQLKNIIAKYTL